MRVIRSSRVWNVHSHSKFSHKDALPDVASMVARAKEMNQPALGLTDHGNMAGSVQLYQECRKANILPFPGTELYVVHDRNDKKAKRHHLTVVSFSLTGYKNLVKLSTLSHRNFHHKPLVDHNDLALLAEDNGLHGLAALSGCLSGFVQQSILRDDHVAARAYLAAYASWFDQFYVELMNHEATWPGENQEHTDDQICTDLVALAEDLGLPMVLSQDAHYLHEIDQTHHDALKRLVSFGPDSDDAVFAGDGYPLASEEHFQIHHPPERYRHGVEGLQDLLGRHTLEIAQLDRYHYNIPFTVEDPLGQLRTRCGNELRNQGLSKGHQSRLDEELEIIGDTGMAGYLILVAEVTDWCRTNKVVFQARGSAAGSICCWLLGITPVDPLKWKLSFERFISRDRTKPPDIDLDVEHWRRKELMLWLSQRFSISQIGNWAKAGLTGEIDLDTGEQDGRGALRIAYFARLKATGNSEINSWSDVPEDDKMMLKELDQLETYKSYGVHAAGIILTTTKQELEELVPLMKVASSGTFASQYAMDDVEELGLVKLDVLGLKTLSVLHRAMDNMNRDPEFDWIPLNDKQTFKSMTTGDTDGIFQLEGWSARKGVQKLKPTTIHDVIAAMALFRPATQNSGATGAYIGHKNGMLRRTERHEFIEAVTKETHYILLYQEQVISVLRGFGMDPDALTKFLKAVKASNQNVGHAGEVIAGYRESVYQMANEKGISDDDWNWLWSAITGFAAYGFNRAHSTVYGLTSYFCGYLVAHHPVEFHAALLAVASGTDKEAKYISTTRKRGIRLAKASINRSEATYRVERNAIRKGLTSIKGVGDKVATAIMAVRPDGGFRDMGNFAELVDHRKVTGIRAYRESGDCSVGILDKLISAGALEDFGDPG